MRSRKSIGIVCVLLLCFALSIPMIAFADESTANDDVLLTEDLAVDIAQGFADSIYPNEGLVAGNPSLFINEEGIAIGYIVSYSSLDQPYGYIVLDSTQKELVSEYVIEKGVVNPFINENAPEHNALRALSSDDNVIVKTSPVTYAIVSESTGFGQDNYGESVELNVSKPVTRNSSPNGWNDIFISYSSSSYDMLENYWATPFLGRTTQQIRNASNGWYACAVSALVD